MISGSSHIEPIKYLSFFFFSEIKTTNKKSKLGSGDGFGYHDHTKRIKKQRVPLYLQINAIFGDSEPECVGEGFGNIHIPLTFNSSSLHFIIEICVSNLAANLNILVMLFLLA